MSKDSSASLPGGSHQKEKNRSLKEYLQVVFVSVFEGNGENTDCTEQKNYPFF
ncbi:TPA: hypothetical protein HA351_12080 [Methanosarcinaceae archaeon]|nr:hypothetical protein [Methanosarcinaceae archaeon]